LADRVELRLAITIYPLGAGVAAVKEPVMVVEVFAEKFRLVACAVGAEQEVYEFPVKGVVV